MTIKQWVNLPKEDVFLDKEIDSVDRCGNLSIEIEVEKPDDAITYKAKITAVGKDKVTYNAAEISRNTNFMLVKGRNGIVDDKKIRVDGIRLPAAGGNKYKIEIEDGAGNVVSSAVEVVAKRKLFYQYMYMDDGVNKVKPYDMSNLESHCKKYHIKLAKAGKDQKVPFNKTVNTGPGGTYNHNNLVTDVGAKYNIDAAQKKLGCVTVLSNYIAYFKYFETPLISYDLSAKKHPLCSISKTEITININKYLWFGLDDDDDNIKRWFIKGEMILTTVDGSQPPIKIDRKNINIAGPNHRKYGGYKKIEIAITPELEKILKDNTIGFLSFKIETNILDGFSGGFSYGGGGFALTTCNTKSWWQDTAPSSSYMTWNHEFGHRIGMVAHGDKDHRSANKKFTVWHYRRARRLPDSAPGKLLYGENPGVNDKGHQGPHCSKGVSYDGSKNIWSGKPGCVMFGSTGTATDPTPKDYCDECTKLVKKLDLSF